MDFSQTCVSTSTMYALPGSGSLTRILLQVRPGLIKMEACAEPTFRAQLLIGSVLHVAAREKVNVQMQAIY